MAWNESLWKRYLEGKATPAERSAVEAHFQSAGAGEGMPPAMAERIRARLERRMTRGKTRTLWMAVAASVVFLTGVGVLWMARKPEPVLAWDRIDNPNGAPKLITLEDKTQVWLHQGAVLYINGRQTRLEGEAYFDVKHAASAPFTVEARGVKTAVLGTAFDIDADSGGVSVSLVRGRVKVNDTLLAPGEMWREGKKARISVEDVAAWINGDLVLNQLPLREALGKLGDYYGVTILADPALCKDKTVTASYHHDEPWRQVLSHLLFIYQLSFTVAPDHTVRMIRQ